MKYVMFDYEGVEVPVIFPGDIFNHDFISVTSNTETVSLLVLEQ